MEFCPRKHLRCTRLRKAPQNEQGATWNGKGTNFAVFSEHATKVEVCLFDDQGEKELERLELPEYTNQVWHGFVEDIRPGTVYGFRVHGPYEPEKGNRFNPNKLLLDPYALEHLGSLKWDPAIFGYQLESGDDRTYDERDSAQFVPKCIVTETESDWSSKPATLRGLRVPWDDTVLYELHVRGFTKQHPDVPEARRGTYEGLGSTAVIDYIKSLGVTSVELLPIHTLVDDGYLLDRSQCNYWGYNSIGFFAPDSRYALAQSHALREFKEMVARFHQADLEVILDVVYNHTAEGNERGPTLSFKGIDNRSYYRLVPGQERYYINDTGTGNTVNLSHPRVIQMVCDSLRYWVEHTGVDGFRFDLGTILAREPNGFDNQSGFLKAVSQDPLLRSVKLIAEPWDCGVGGYQVGGFPPGWTEWNDTFRDTVRSFWKGDSTAAQMGNRLSASGDLFNRIGRRPWASINFITAHDGFTLRDLVSYNDKHNEPNGDNNQDGTENNLSWNCGAEGPTDDPAINTLRLRQQKNLLATLLLSQGTPMLMAGDEFGRTQNGNNNAYCHDNEITWVDWKLAEENAHLVDYVRTLARLRHKYPILRRNLFLTGQYDETLQVKDVTWINANGAEMSQEDWNNGLIRCFGMLLDGRAQPTGVRQRGKEATLLTVINDHYEMVKFTLPPCAGAESWHCLIDTNLETDVKEPAYPVGAQYDVTARSLLVFVLEETEDTAR